MDDVLASPSSHLVSSWVGLGGPLNISLMTLVTSFCTCSCSSRSMSKQLSSEFESTVRLKSIVSVFDIFGGGSNDSCFRLVRFSLSNVRLDFPLIFCMIC